MSRFARVVVYPAEHTTADPAIAQAERLGVAGASLTLVDVIRPTTRGLSWNQREDEAQAAVARRRLGAVAEVLERRGIEVRVEVSFGMPAEVLRDLARWVQADLIIKTARLEDTKRLPIFGAVARGLACSAPCPVWLVRRRALPMRRVLAAIDLDADAVDGRADEVLGLARAIAGVTQSELHVAQSWTAPLVGMVASPVFGGSVIDAHDYLMDGARHAAEALGPVLSRHGLSLGSPEVHLRRGGLTQVAGALASRLEAEIVVTSVHDVSELHAVLLEPPGLQMLRTFDRSVVVLPPKLARASLPS
ncbi:universal stress protein [Myxococcota bacterium]|nr:universal stress protein [Myxococcota bacterium]